jgi:Mn2+/Fe2+ NRAMP family transporter
LSPPPPPPPLGPEIGSGGTIALPLPPLTHEDLCRSRDRRRVHHARTHRRRLHLLWLLIGPGILVMLGENDGPSMISYTATGATYGVGFFLPFILLTFAMAYVCQEMAMRVGAVTHRGYGQLVLQRYGRAWGWLAAIDLLFTNLVTLIAELVAIRVGSAYFLGPGALSAQLSALLGVGLVALTLSLGRYWRWERLVLALAILNCLFVPVAILAHPHWGAAAHALVTLSPFPHGSINTLLLLIASTIGATVTPWMIFFQQSASADKGLTPHDVRHGRYDTLAGAVLAALFGCAALLAGAALFGHGGEAITGFAGAGFPRALAARAGSVAGALFALGLIEAGAVALLAISASTGYALGECVGACNSFNSRPRHATLFYGVNIAVAVVAAGVILIPGAPLLAIALNANVLATVLLPVTLIFVILLASDRELMGSFASSRARNITAILIVAVVSTAGAAYAIDSFLQATHLIGG